MRTTKMLNIGCGATHHPDWINLDVSSKDPSVLTIDINNGLPFASDSVTICYSSHLLEHLDNADARNFLSECFRVLKTGGVIRLVVPNLEGIVREYLSILDAVASGDKERESDYDWIMLELYDQAVRNFSGGGMASFLINLNENDRAFVRSRIGAEAEKFWESKQAGARKSWRKVLAHKGAWSKFLKLLRENLAGLLVFLIAGKTAYKSFRLGIFRNSGEVHQWMYDRYSLKRLLERAGFVSVKICSANESRIPGYEKYSLDALNGIARKPDSLYIEAFKP